MKRESQVQSNDQKNKSLLQDQNIIKSIPQIGDPLYDREAASMIRSDMIITSSDYEDTLLKSYFPSCQSKTEISTYFYHTEESKEKFEIDQRVLQQDFSRRKNFVFIGNMALLTNQDTVKYLIKNIWPQLKKLLPSVELHIYGLPKEKSDSKLGVKCFSEMTHINQLAKYRALLAPIRFGSGIKAKIADSWEHHLPVVTTPIGAEGMFKQSTKSLDYMSLQQQGHNVRFFNEIKPQNLSTEDQQLGQLSQDNMAEYYNYNFKDDTNIDFGGSYLNFNDEQFIQSALDLYTDEDIWTRCSKMGQEILKMRMDKNINNTTLMRAISQRMTNYQDLRKQNILYKQTWDETLRSNPSFVKFISERRKQSNTHQSLMHK